MSNSIKEKRIKEKKAAKVASEKQQDAKLYRLMLQFALVFVAVVLFFLPVMTRIHWSFSQ